MSAPTDSFKDHLYNTDESGRRIGFFPKRPRGRFYNRRILVSVVLLLVFFGLPWIKVNGDPFFMLNFVERKFILFGQVFMPQDFLLLALLVIALFYFIFVFTSVLGRIWCGWTCPQTIFLEMVYRRIEYWIEGDSSKQRKLAKADWKWEKIWKRTLKHSIFIVIAAAVSHTVMAFILGMDNVLLYIKDGPSEHWVTFAFVVANTAAFYLVFSWFREQACIYVCPYGRLQGVLLNKNSLVISYDHVRGEPPGKIKRNDPNPDLGDCIDCKQCVAVCPTGIDIRNGTQLECVNCTACIDACDDIMDKVGRPRGLIRYASQEGIETGKKFKLTTQAYVYAAGLVAVTGLFLFLLLGSGDIKTTLLRAPGQTYTMTPEGNVTNLYTIKVLNKKSEDRIIDFRLEEGPGHITLLGAEHLELPASGMGEASLIVELPPSALEGLSFSIDIELLEEGEVIETIGTKFNGPML